MISGGISSLGRIFWRMFDHSFAACKFVVFLCVFWVFFFFLSLFCFGFFCLFVVVVCLFFFFLCVCVCVCGLFVCLFVCLPACFEVVISLRTLVPLF